MRRSRSRRRAPLWAWLRTLAGLGILGLLAGVVGFGPFVDGLRLVTAPALAMAGGVGALITLCCAWRWRLVAAGLGVQLPLRRAVADYYRAQFLNTTLPGGVAGDVHRAVRHGLDIGDVGLGVRAVVLERVAGQVVLVGVALIILLGLPSPVRAYLPVVAGALVLAGLSGVVAARVLRRRTDRLTRALRRTWHHIRDGLFGRRNGVAIVATSTVVAAGHLATLLLAARTAGATAPVVVLLPLVLLALLAMAVPLNLAGWGPREGVAAWVFAAAGLGATQGVATAVVYGVFVAAASLPGAAVLLVRRIGARNGRRAATAVLIQEVADLPAEQGAPQESLPRAPRLQWGEAGG